MVLGNFDWSLPFAFFWGLFVLLALIGWGRLIEKWVAAPGGAAMGWATAASWGMAIFIVLSGPLILLSAFSIFLTAIFLAIGWIRFSMEWPTIRAYFLTNHNPSRRLKAVLFVTSLFVLLAYAAAVAEREYSQYDDVPAYFYLTQKLFQTGTLYDPFSFRLLGALGGQLDLSALTLGFLPWKYAALLDQGLAFLIVLGLTQEFLPRADRWTWFLNLLLLSLALTYVIPRDNTASENTAVALFFAIFRAFDAVRREEITGWRAACLLGGLMTAAATLRCHHVFIVGALAAAFFLTMLWNRKPNSQAVFALLGRTLMAVAVMMLSWWIIAYRSGGTFLYPLIKGNHQPTFEVFSGPLTLKMQVWFIVGFFATSSYLLFFLPLCFIRNGPERRFLLLYGCTILLLTLGVTTQLNYSTGLYFHILRYLAPLAWAFCLYTSGILARQLANEGPRLSLQFASLRTILPLLAAASVLALHLVSFTANSLLNILRIGWALDSTNPTYCILDGRFIFYHPQAAVEDYKKAFAKIPRGETVLTAVNYPFLLTMRDWKIFCIDQPGAASPPPGLVYFKGPGMLKEGLQKQHIDYLAISSFDQGELFYSYKMAQMLLRSKETFRDSRIFGAYDYDFMKNADSLSTPSNTLYRSPYIKIIRLDTAGN